MTQKNFSSLDFNDFKDSLKEFLKSQSKFSDYNFEGSNLSIILDLLTYNTQYISFYLNMVANEMFLDSAILRDSIVSRAKHISYVTRSTKSARAKVNLEIFPQFGAGDANPDSITVSDSTIFYATLDNKKYYFYPSKPTTIFRDETGRYVYNNLELIEGQKLTFKWTVDFTQPLKQKFIIPNSGVDTDSLIVKVLKSSTETTESVYTKNDDITTLDNNSLVYFLQETNDKKYEIYFGDGVIGKALEQGNIVSITYQVSSGESANGIRVFTPAGNISGYTRTSITTTQIARDGKDIESDESIKLLAPLNYASQSRAVTKQDYETLIKKDIASAEFVRVWGGEENDPVQYGKVFVAVKPFEDYSFTEEQKFSLVNNIIKKRNIISLDVEIVEPEFLYLVPSIKVYYNSKNTTLTEAEIRNKIVTSVKNFAKQELSGFDADFKYSKFISAIDGSDSSIIKNNTTLLLKSRVRVTFNRPEKKIISLNNSLSTGDAINNVSSIKSSSFNYRNLDTYIGDDGQGNLYLYRLLNNTKSIIQRNLGTVDYSTGKIVINKLDVQPSNKEYVDIFCIPKVFDITSLRNQILILENVDINVSLEDLSRK